MLQDNKGQHYCLVPILPERKFGPEVSNHRARLIRTAEKNGLMALFFIIVS